MACNVMNTQFYRRLQGMAHGQILDDLLVLYQAECATGFWTYRFLEYFILRSDCHASRLQNPDVFRYRIS